MTKISIEFWWSFWSCATKATAAAKSAHWTALKAAAASQWYNQCKQVLCSYAVEPKRGYYAVPTNPKQVLQATANSQPASNARHISTILAAMYASASLVCVPTVTKVVSCPLKLNTLYYMHGRRLLKKLYFLKSLFCVLAPKRYFSSAAAASREMHWCKNF